MAATAGKDGSVIFGGDTMAFVDSWTLSSSADVYDTSSFGDNDRTFIAGIRNATGTISGTFDNSDTAQAAIVDQMVSGGTIAATELTLRVDDSAPFGFKAASALLTNFEVSSSATDKVSFSATFQISGGFVESTT